MPDIKVIPDTESTIEQIWKSKKDGALPVDPEYQRGKKWKPDQQKLFIDSILRGYHLPPFYFHALERSSLLGKKHRKFNIVDGQQRIDAITRFRDGELKLLDPANPKDFSFPNFVGDDKCPWAGKKFDELDKELQNAFSNHKVVIYQIHTENDRRIRDLFIRLQGGVHLNEQEKRDAWPGKFTDFIFEAGGKTSEDGRWPGWDFFKKAIRQSDDSKRRQQVAICYMLFHKNRHKTGFVDAKAPQINAFYHEQNLNFTGNNEDARRFEKICKKLASIYERYPQKLSAHHLLHLILFMDTILDKAVNTDLFNIPNALNTFRERCSEAKKAFEKKKEHSKYYDEYAAHASGPGSGSNNALRIQQRHSFFLEAMKSIASIEFRDEERIFSDVVKEIAFYRDEPHCQLCLMKGIEHDPITFGKVEFHHVRPHSKGGRSTRENCATMHKDCHKEVHKNLKEFEKWWRGDRNPKKQTKSKKLPPDGTKLRFASDAHNCHGIIKDGQVCLDGHRKTYTSLSDAAKVVTGWKSANGWREWEVQTPDNPQWMLASVWKDQE